MKVSEIKEKVRFGEKVRQQRLDLGIEQVAISREIGVTTETIRKIERGLTIPNLATALALTERLNFSLDALIDEI